MQSTTPSGRVSQSRRLDLHQHVAVYKTAASLFGHVGKQECEDSNPVGRLWRPLPLPGGRSYIGPDFPARGLWRNNYSCSITFQYASLTNFSQLATRTLWSA